MLSPTFHEGPTPMHLRACFLLTIITCQQLLIPAATSKPAAAPRPVYVLTNGSRRLSLKYLSKRERMVLQQVMHIYQHQGMPLAKNTSSALRKKLLVLLLLLLLGGSLCYVGYRLLKPSPSSFAKATADMPSPPVAHPLAQPISQATAASLPTAHAAYLQQAQQMAREKTKPSMTDEERLEMFLQAAHCMHVTDEHFKHDALLPLIGSVFNMTQEAKTFLSGIPDLSSFSHGSQHTPLPSYQDDPFIAAIPQVPRTRPEPSTLYGSSKPQAKPKAPISVYVPTGSALEARFEKLKK